MKILRRLSYVVFGVASSVGAVHAQCPASLAVFASQRVSGTVQISDQGVVAAVAVSTFKFTASGMSGILSSVAYIEGQKLGARNVRLIFSGFNSATCLVSATAKDISTGLTTGEYTVSINQGALTGYGYGVGGTLEGFELRPN